MRARPGAPGRNRSWVLFASWVLALAVVGAPTEAAGHEGCSKTWDASKSAWVFRGDGHDNKCTGTDGKDIFWVEGGNDKVYGLAGNDEIHLGDGNDWGEGWSGDDTIYGGNGNDTIWGMLGKDWISAGDGSDAINGGDGADTLITGGVSDLYDSDTAYGAGGEDRIKGGPSNDTVHGEGGADWVQENIGPNGDYDTFYGGPGTDSGAFSDGDFNDKFYGESGNDCCPDGDCQIGGECETANWTWGADEGSGDKCACSGGHNCAA